ncbi:MAG: cyclic nucleotide-binding domain-containing protein [Thermodesulfobacteriota bacterium]|nr:cyclic nucleotide-binding domain-containing protein [Thermodesulfobacteriota bacterium]
MVSAEWLKKAELFESLDQSQLDVLFSHSLLKSYPKGETIFGQGEEANHLYLLIEGSVDLTVKAQEQVNFMTSRIEKEGAVFGTGSLMEPFRYNVTAVCLKPTKILTIEADHMKRMMEDDPKMGMEIMKKLATIYFNRLNQLRSGVSNLLNIFKIKVP